LEATHHEWVVAHRPGLFEYLVQLGIVLVGAASETRPDEVVATLVELPPRALEVQHLALAVGQLTVAWIHPDSLTRVHAEVEDASN
jgi:hypothetical protein